MQVDYSILNPQIVPPPGTLKPPRARDMSQLTGQLTNTLVSLEVLEAKSQRGPAS